MCCPYFENKTNPQGIAHTYEKPPSWSNQRVTVSLSPILLKLNQLDLTTLYITTTHNGVMNGSTG